MSVFWQRFRHKATDIRLGTPNIILVLVERSVVSRIGLIRTFLLVVILAMKSNLSNCVFVKGDLDAVDESDSYKINLYNSRDDPSDPQFNAFYVAFDFFKSCLSNLVLVQGQVGI